MTALRELNTRDIQAEGFQAGTQGVEPEAQLKEIDSGFGRLKERVKQEATDRIKQLEAAIETLKARLKDAEERWGDFQIQTDGMPPAIVLPLCAVAVALLVVTGEGFFLAPVMDALGIADRTAQMVFASVIVMVTSGLVKITKRQLLSHAEEDPDHQYAETETPRRGRFARYLKASLVIFLTVVSLTFVFFLGWWRAEQMIFAASLQHTGAWKQFMADNPGLTRAVVVLLTTGLPIFVAIVFEWGLDGLRLAWEWRKARYEVRRFGKLLNRTEKKLESENETRDSKLAELNETCEEWKNGYAHHHAMGKQIGAWKTPLWRVILKIAAVVFILAAACFLLDPLISAYVVSEAARLFIYALVTLGFGGLYAAHAIKAWDRPNAKQLFKQRATIWRDAPTLLQPTLPENNNGKKSILPPMRVEETEQGLVASAHTA
jgi:ABC-type multidrug transport system fused ATPase/permease subunit